MDVAAEAGPNHVDGSTPKTRAPGLGDEPGRHLFAAWKRLGLEPGSLEAIKAAKLLPDASELSLSAVEALAAYVDGDSPGIDLAVAEAQLWAALSSIEGEAEAPILSPLRERAKQSNKLWAQAAHWARKSAVDHPQAAARADKARWLYLRAIEGDRGRTPNEAMSARGTPRREDGQPGWFRGGPHPGITPAQRSALRDVSLIPSTPPHRFGGHMPPGPPPQLLGWLCVTFDRLRLAGWSDASLAALVLGSDLDWGEPPCPDAVRQWSAGADEDGLTGRDRLDQWLRDLRR